MYITDSLAIYGATWTCFNYLIAASNKKASICWQDSAPPISGHWSTSELNARDQDFPLTGSNFGNLTAFRAIFSHIFTAHAQEWPLMNFRLKFWHHHSISWSRFPYRARYFRDTRTFSVDFCIGYAECPPYFYFRSSWPTDLESVSRDAHLAVTVSTKFEVDTTIGCLVIALLLLIRYVILWPWPLTF